jgi:hypothetical protein
MAAMRIKKTMLTLLVVLVICGNVPILHSASLPTKKLQLILLENGIFDCAEVIDSANRYFNSIAYLGFEASISKISQILNNEIGIDSFIENQYYSNGVETFILVGNDLRFPLRVWEESSIAAPADGVLCDTNHELSVEGWNQTVKAFTAEVSVAYIFPPKYGLSIDAQRKLVTYAFNKFEKFHRGMVARSNMGVACGHLDGDFETAIDRMASASEALFGKENTIEKELSKAEITTYFQKTPTFFGVAGHGSPYVVETSSDGTQLDCNDLSGSKTPLAIEIFGCWTSGWNFESKSYPWNALGGTLTMSGLFSNDYTMAIVAGFPESSAEYSFSLNVLSEFKYHSGATLGELMRNKSRRCGDWVLFGDPAFTIETSPGINNRPVASIEYLYPTMIEQGTSVYFKGSGFDSDGTIVAYSWRSNLDGQLSASSSFSTTTLSVGTHKIYFKVKDNRESWSDEIMREVIVLSLPAVYITHPENKGTVEGVTTINVDVVFARGSVRSVAFYIDGRYVGYDGVAPYEFLWDTRSYRNGEHWLNAEASLVNPVRTIKSAETIVNISNPLPTVKIVTPTNGSKLQGSFKIVVEASDVDKIGKANFYIDNVFVGNDYAYPFEWTWDTTASHNGLHEMFVEVYYSHIRQYIRSPKTVVTVENPANEIGVTILFPANASVISGTVTIQVIANGENLNRVYFYIDGVWKGYDFGAPYTLEWNTIYVPDGWHEIYVVALYGTRTPYQEMRSETVRVFVNN